MFQMLYFSLKDREEPHRDYALFREVSDAVKNVQEYNTDLDGVNVLIPQLRIP
jgi:hypothetical protein